MVRYHIPFIIPERYRYIQKKILRLANRRGSQPADIPYGNVRLAYDKGRYNEKQKCGNHFHP